MSEDYSGLLSPRDLNTVGNRSREQNNNATKIFLFYTESDREGNDNCPNISPVKREMIRREIVFIGMIWNKIIL